MLIGKLFQIGYTPRSSVAAGAPERPARPEPRPRARERDAAAAAVRQASGPASAHRVAAKVGAGTSGTVPPVFAASFG